MVVIFYFLLQGYFSYKSYFFYYGDKSNQCKKIHFDGCSMGYSEKEKVYQS